MTQRRSSPLGLELVIPAIMLFMLFPLLTQAAPFQDITEIQQYTEGCYYNYNHYNEGDRILTNEPCLNCTCHNKMLMCYLRVCPFTKPIGHDCVVEKREDQCCPIITCPEVPVDVAHHIPEPGTELSIPEKYGCSIDDRFYPEGAQVPSNPNKPCELCYCIKNRTSCLMQECTLHIDGCQPIYNKGSCCPVRYNCDHENDILELEDHSTSTTTTVRPTPGFILTTTMTPAVSTECIHNGNVYADGASLLGKNSCEHCYCMRGDIVCAVQECEMPMLAGNGKSCQPLPPDEGECCPSNYVCEADTATTTDSLNDVTTMSNLDEEVKVTTTSPIKDLHSSISIEDLQLQKHIDDDGQLPTEPNKIDQSRPISEDMVVNVGQETTLSPVLPDQINDEVSVSTANSLSEEIDLTVITTLKTPINADENIQTITPKYSDTETSPVYEKEEDKYEPATFTDANLHTSTEKYDEKMTRLEDKTETIPMVEDDLLGHTTEKLSFDDLSFGLEISTPKSEVLNNKKDEADELVDDTIKRKQDGENVSISEEEDYSLPTTAQTLVNKDIMETTVKTDTFKGISDIPLKSDDTTKHTENIEVTTLKIDTVAEKDTTVPEEKNIQITTTLQPQLPVNTDKTQVDDGSTSDIKDVITNTTPVVLGDEMQPLDDREDIKVTVTTLKPTLTSEDEEDTQKTTFSSESTELHNTTPAGETLNGPESQPTNDSVTMNKIDDDSADVAEETTTANIALELESHTGSYPPTLFTSVPEKHESTTEVIPTSSADNYLFTEHPIRTTEHMTLSSTTADENASNVEQSTLGLILADEITPEKAYDMETIPTAIPGEGHCLVGQKTYPHNSLVQPSDKCDSSCRCLSSIIVCEPVQCELPKDIEKCTVDMLGSDECCPTYNCETDSNSEKTDDVTESEINKEDDQTVPPEYLDTSANNISSLLINETKAESSSALPTDITIPTMATDQPMSHIKYENNDENILSTTYVPPSTTSTYTSEPQKIETSSTYEEKLPVKPSEKQPESNQDNISLTKPEAEDATKLHEAEKTQFDDEKIQPAPSPSTEIDMTESADSSTKLTESSIEVQFSSMTEKPETPVGEGSGFFPSTSQSEIEKLDSTEDSTTKGTTTSNETDEEIIASTTEDGIDAIKGKPFNNEDQTTEQTHYLSMNDLFPTTTSPTKQDESNLSTVPLPIDDQLSVDKGVDATMPPDGKIEENTNDETLFHTITPVTDDKLTDVIDVTTKEPINLGEIEISDEHLQQTSSSSNDKDFFKPTTVANIDYDSETTTLETDEISNIIPEGAEVEKTPKEPESLQNPAPSAEDKETSDVTFQHSTLPSAERKEDGFIDSDFQTLIPVTTENSGSEHVQKIPPRTVPQIVVIDKETDTSPASQETENNPTSTEVDNSEIDDLVKKPDPSDSESDEGAYESASTEDVAPESTEGTNVETSTEGVVTSGNIEETYVSGSTEGAVTSESTEGAHGPESTEEADSTEGSGTNVSASTEGTDEPVPTDGVEESIMTDGFNVSTSTEDVDALEPSEAADALESTEESIIKPIGDMDTKKHIPVRDTPSQTSAPTVDGVIVSDNEDNKSQVVEVTLSQTTYPTTEHKKQQNYDEEKKDFSLDETPSSTEFPVIENQTEITENNNNNPETVPETMSQTVGPVVDEDIKNTGDKVIRTDEPLSQTLSPDVGGEKTHHESVTENVDIDMKPIDDENKDISQTMTQTVTPHLDDDYKSTEGDNKKDDKFLLHTDAPSTDINIEPIDDEEAQKETSDETYSHTDTSSSDDETLTSESGMKTTGSPLDHTIVPHSEVEKPLSPNDIPASLDQEKELTKSTVDLQTQTDATTTEDIKKESKDNIIYQASTEDNQDYSNIMTSTTGNQFESLDETTENIITSSKDDNKPGDGSIPHTTVSNSEEDTYSLLSSTMSPASENDSSSDILLDSTSSHMDEGNNQFDESTHLPTHATPSEENDKTFTESPITNPALEAELSDNNVAQTTLSSEKTPSSKNPTIDETMEFTSRPDLYDENNITVDILSTETVPNHEEVVTKMPFEPLPSSSSPVNSEVEKTTDKFLIQTPTTYEDMTEQATEESITHSISPIIDDEKDVKAQNLSHTITSVADMMNEGPLDINVDLKNDGFSEESSIGYGTPFTTVSPAFDTGNLQATSPGEEFEHSTIDNTVPDHPRLPFNEKTVKEKLFETNKSQTASPIMEDVYNETTEGVKKQTTTPTTSLHKEHEGDSDTLQNTEDHLQKDKISTESKPLLTENVKYTTHSTAGQDKDSQTDEDDVVSNTDKPIVMDTISSTTDITLSEKEATFELTDVSDKEDTFLDPHGIEQVNHQITTENILSDDEKQKETTTHIALDSNKDQSITEVELTQITSTEKPIDGISETTENSSVENKPITIEISTDKESTDQNLQDITVNTTPQSGEHTPFTHVDELPHTEEDTAGPTRDESDLQTKTETKDESTTVSPSVIENLDSDEETDESIESEEEITSDPSALNIQQIGQFVTDRVDDTFTEAPNKINTTNVQEDNNEQTTADERDEVPNTTSVNSIVQTTNSTFFPDLVIGNMDSANKPTDYPKDQNIDEITQIIPVTSTPSPDSLHIGLETTTAKEDQHDFSQISLDLESDTEESNGEDSSSTIHAAENPEESKESEEENANDADMQVRTTISPMLSYGATSTTSRPHQDSDLGVRTSTDAYESTEKATEKRNQTTTSAAPTTQEPSSTTASSTQYSQPPTSYGGHPHQYPSYPEDEYTDEDETEVFGPGTCRYGGKLFVSAQQIPRDDPCDFCFCFRSDIICLQQSCPPPISGCHEEPISGFCCPRYECPVSMATVLNITTSTTTTSTTLPPHFLHHAYEGAAERNGCHINGKSYRVGEKIDATSGPCMHCTCGGDGQMKCDPKTCSPEPMLQQMIAVVASRRR